MTTPLMILRASVKARDGRVCQYCGTNDPAAYYALDHVIPRKLGGPDTAYNLVIACQPCNSRKGRWHVWIPANLDAITADAPEWRDKIRHLAAHPELCWQPLSVEQRRRGWDITLTPAEQALIEQAAQQAGLPARVWARQVLVQAAKEQTGE